MAAASEVRYGGFFRRFVAWVIDLIIIIVPSIVLLAVFGVIGDPTLIDIVGILASFFYESLFLALWSTTPGKRIVGLVVVHETEGYPIGLLRALQRTLWKTVIPIAVSALLIFFDPRNRAAHDKVADTYVIYKDSIEAFRNRAPGQVKEKKVTIPSKGGAPPLEVVYREPETKRK